MKEGGAVYDYISGLQVGIANLSDSLAAIKKLVFEEGRLTPAELWHALETDYAGERGKEIQEMLIHDAPKYGNDDYADKLVTDATIFMWMKSLNIQIPAMDVVRLAVSATQEHLLFQPMSVKVVVLWRRQMAAMPGHRSLKDAHHLNMDKNGPTSVLKSVSKLPTDENRWWRSA